MDNTTIKLIAESKRSREDMIKYALQVVGDELRSKGVNLYQNDPTRYKISIFRSDWNEIFRYELDGW